MPVNTFMSKTKQLRALLDPSRLDFILEAHNGLSARIAEEAGFKAIWASGLAISASLGVRDNNEASWTQMLEIAEYMADATRVPILLDGDTGHGNFNNFRRLVQKLEQRGIAGVCIEDKVFPKTNSFLRGETQPLAAVEEFCGKISAGKESQRDADFVIVARTEALIAGWGLAEAVRRAEAYRLAGADAIVVHSAQSKPDEVFAFLEAWAGRHPVILIPTKYHTTPTEAFAQRRVSALIWANHLMRASLTAMQRCAKQIRRDNTISGVEEEVAPLREVFRLQGDAELQSAEERFLAASPRRSAIVLAATRGSGALHPLTEEIPKCLLRVGGVSLLDRLCDNLSALNTREITVVAGYRAATIVRAGVRLVENDAWETTGELSSLAVAAGALNGPGMLAFGDILCRRHILASLLDDEADLVVAADRRIRQPGAKVGRGRDLLRLSAPAAHAFLDAECQAVEAAFSADYGDYDAEWIGLLKYSTAGAGWIREWVESNRGNEDFIKWSVIDLLAGLLAQGRKVKVHVVSGDWTTVEDACDLAEASNL
jgi:phosphoenolpyruvate phosphomutase